MAMCWVTQSKLVYIWAALHLCEDNDFVAVALRCAVVDADGTI